MTAAGAGLGSLFGDEPSEMNVNKSMGEVVPQVTAPVNEAGLSDDSASTDTKTAVAGIHPVADQQAPACYVVQALLCCSSTVGVFPSQPLHLLCMHFIRSARAVTDIR